jgi:hypothetical protein
VNYLWGQIGWTIASESNLRVGVDFVPVSDFDKKDIRTHICEVRARARLSSCFTLLSSCFKLLYFICGIHGAFGIYYDCDWMCMQVQMMLEPLHKLKVERCHASFVKARNLLSK